MLIPVCLTQGTKSVTPHILAVGPYDIEWYSQRWTTLTSGNRHIIFVQILTSLDVALPGEKKRWWRRQVDGETSHLALLSKNIAQKYRGPIWTENRYTSGKPVTAKVLVSVNGDFLVEMEPRGEKGRHAGGFEGGGSTFSPGTVLRLEVTAQELRAVFRGLGEAGTMGDGEGSADDLRGVDAGWRLAPGRRVEICRCGSQTDMGFMRINMT